jgi:hypothetical protein|uniref:Uncharacterized protein n=1 Tax=Podoviridae sp. ctUS21 TaxID=2826557 RepID=A0A8S5MQ07_9CAUD|nr:MAG TPA: hypothetical protein [Podoviridae sp. ctUS21]
MFKFLRLKGAVLELRHRVTGSLVHILDLGSNYRLMVGDKKQDFAKSVTLAEVLSVADRMAEAEK